jgi:hypothetical protein
VLPARRTARAVVVAALLLAACSDGDDDASEDPPEEATTTTEAPADPGAPPPALDEAEAVEGDDLEALDELIAFVEDARGRDFLQRPIVRLAEDDLYAQLARDLLDVDLQALLAEGAYLEALGLIPEGAAQDYAEARLGQIIGSAGFYDAASGVLLVRGADLEPPGTRTIVVHELVHAHDDQHLGLDRPGFQLDRTTERSVTFQALVEGDAVRVEEAYLASLPVDEQEAAMEVVGQLPDDLDGAESILEFRALAPYVLGRDFVLHVATSGETAVDAAFADPPPTTEQLLHVDAFDRGEGRRRVPPPPADAPVVDQGVQGELFWTGLLRFSGADLDPATASAASEGWGGDQYVAWLDEDGRTCIRSDVEGDTATDTAELLAALQVWVQDRPEAVVEPTPEGRVRVEVCFAIPAAPVGNPDR